MEGHVGERRKNERPKMDWAQRLVFLVHSLVLDTIWVLIMMSA
jgi:hypothetical protein